MGKYKIKICSHAKMDLRDIVDYLNTLPPPAAIKYYDLLVEKIGGLTDTPERCPFVRDVALKAKGCRYLVHENYVVIFVVGSDAVQIRRVVYSKRNYEWLL